MIPIDSSGTRHMAMMFRESAPSAPAKMPRAEKPGMGHNPQQGIGKPDPQATRSAGDCTTQQKAHDLVMDTRMRRLTEAAKHRTQAHDASLETRIRDLIHARDAALERRIRHLTQAHGTSVEERIRDLIRAHDTSLERRIGT